MPHDLATLRLAGPIMEAGRVHPLLGFGICAGECGGDITHTPRRGDGGASGGIIQVYTVVHGHDPSYWEGLDGARRSLERAVYGTTTPAWRLALEDTVADLGPYNGKADWFAEFWIRAQGCDPDLARQNAPWALARGIEAWETYRADKASVANKAAGILSMPPLHSRPAHSDHYGPRVAGVDWEAIVLHITDGGDPSGWFGMSAAQRGGSVGATPYSVGKDGAARQHVALTYTAYAHGDFGEGGTARLLRENAGIDPNHWAIAIEHDGRPGDQPTEAQFDTSTRLSAALFRDVLFTGSATGVAVDRDHILMHADISPRSRARCPGWGEETQARYIARVRELLTSTAPVPVIEPPAPVPVIDPRDATIVQLRDALTVVGADLARAQQLLAVEAYRLGTTAENLAALVRSI